MFLNIYLPCKDGLSCIKEIRQNRCYDDVPVIVYTGSNRHSNIEEAYTNVANYYLTKSTSFEDLVNKLKMVLAHDWKASMVYPSRDQFLV